MPPQPVTYSMRSAIHVHTHLLLLQGASKVERQMAEGVGVAACCPAPTANYRLIERTSARPGTPWHLQHKQRTQQQQTHACARMPHTMHGAVDVCHTQTHTHTCNIRTHTYKTANCAAFSNPVLQTGSQNIYTSKHSHSEGLF